MENYQMVLTTTIAINTAASAAIPLHEGQRLLGIWMPAAWDAGAVKLAFKTHPGTGVIGADTPAYNDSGWQQVVAQGGGLVLVTLHATPTGKYIHLAEEDTLIAAPYIQIVGVETGGEVTVNQTAARTIKVLVGPSN